MAHISDIHSGNETHSENTDIVQLSPLESGNIHLPEGHFVGDAQLSRDGQDLTLEFSNGDTFAVKSYFLDQNDFLIQDSSGGILSEGLVNSFLQSSPEYAQSASMSDESPVGAVEEMKGSATVTRADGTTDEITLGSPIYQGDVIQTSGDGAVNILFLDETSMAISEDARISIDNYKFDPATESGETDLSVLRGVFVYTSGLIGRDDPDDVEINTPVGSIGIRGTIIAGNIDPEGNSEISVLEGAIVVKNASGETTLSQQYETVKLSGFQEAIEYKGVEAANDIGKTYGSVSDVLPKLFSSIDDAAKEESKTQNDDKQTKEQLEQEAEAEAEEAVETAKEEGLKQEAQEQSANEPIKIIQQEKIAPQLSEEIKAEAENLDKQDILKKAVRKSILSNKDRFEKDDVVSDAQEQNDAYDINLNPDVIQNNLTLFEGSGAGTVVSSILLKDYPTGTTINFATDSTDYAINQISGTNRFKITLTATGANASNGTPGTTMDALDLVVTLPNGKTIDIPAYTPQITDAAVHLNSTGGLSNYDVSVGASPVDTTRLMDFDGDGNQDYLKIVESDNSALNQEVGIYSNTTGENIYNSPSSSTKWTAAEFVGDINNDGHADIVGLISDPSNIDYSIIEGNDLSTTQTPTQHNFSFTTIPTSVTFAGDFNADSKSDFIIGAAGDNGDKGRLIIQYGTSSDSLTVNGATAGMRLGETAHNIKDFNGDGISDIIATTATDTAFVIFGQSDSDASITTDDLNGSSDGFKIDAGLSMVATEAAGDINGDGFDDFAISLDDGTDVNTYVVYGNSTSTNINLDFLENPNNALKINHAGADATNYQITDLGDVNGDGFDDIQVGNSTEQFIIHGNIGGNNVPYATDGTATDNDGETGRVAASTNNQSLVGDVDFNDGNFDGTRMSGGSSNNSFEINNKNFARIDGGDGFDKISFVENGGSLNFSNFLPEQIEQIEALDFGGTSQTIKLTAENIFNMFKSSDNGELRIMGDSTSTLKIDSDSANDVSSTLNEVGSGASFAGNTDIDGEGYWHYQVGGYDLYIDQDVTVSIV